MSKLTQPQISLLRMMATTAQRSDMDVGLGANVLLALLDELEVARRVVCVTRSMPNALMMDALDAYDRVTTTTTTDRTLGACPRCGAPLDNVSPGISVVTGGVSVCTSCLAPGEVEIARARGM
jgi:hypothetical protein